MPFFSFTIGEIRNILFYSSSLVTFIVSHQGQLNNSNVILGNVKNTLDTFLENPVLIRLVRNGLKSN